MKELPHNYEAEKTVLGAIIASNASRVELVNGLEEEDFYGKNSPNALIFRAISKIVNEGENFDIPSLINELDINMKVLDKVGGIEYIKDLQEYYIGDKNAFFNKGTIKDNALSRRLILCLQKYVDGFEKESFNDVGQYVAECEKDILQITQGRRVSEFRSASEIVDEITNDLQIRKNTKQNKKFPGLDTGYPLLSYYTQGWQPGQLNILAARPSVGKTAFALNLAYLTATREDKTVAFFSLEMDAKSIVRRLLALVSCVNSLKFSSGDLDDTDWLALEAGVKTLKKTKIVIDDTAAESLSNIKTKAQRLKANHPDLCCIFIDYLGLISTSGKRYDSRQNEVAEISRQLKALARELEVPIICLSQLSRDSEKRSGAERMPKLSDLRDSGAIEQDADVVMFIHRDKYQNAESEVADQKVMDTSPFGNPQDTKINVAKNRNGKTGIIDYVFLMNIGKFDEKDTRLDK